MGMPLLAKFLASKNEHTFMILVPMVDRSFRNSFFKYTVEVYIELLKQVTTPPAHLPI